MKPRRSRFDIMKRCGNAPLGIIAFASSIILGLPAVVLSQTDRVFDAKGFQQNHDYFSRQPFEHIDIGTGSLILTFTDLILPGNGGHELKFQRTYSNKDSSWTYWPRRSGNERSRHMATAATSAT